MRAMKSGGATYSASESGHTRRTTNRRTSGASAVALLLGVTLGLVPATVAHAETPTTEDSSSLNMRCLGSTQIGGEVELYVIRSSEEPGTVAELFVTTAVDEEPELWTSTDAIIADGVVSANIPLGGADAVKIAGTYRAVSDPVTVRQRFRIDNSVKIGTLVYQPFAVQLTTSDLGSIGPVDLYCDVESIEQSAHWSNPHRVVMRAQQPAVELDSDCAVGAVTSVQLLAAESEYVLIAQTADAFGYGYVTPNGGSGELAWFSTTNEELVSVQAAQVSMQRSGAPLVSTTADGTTTSVVQATPQDVRLTFGLPDGDTYDRTCSGHSITRKFSTADTGR